MALFAPEVESAEIFSSGDNLHADLFPIFCRKDQHFVAGGELKVALREMSDYYDRMSAEEKKNGSMTYADYPPVAMDNAITKLFDTKFPNWREGANLPRPPRDTSCDAEKLAEFQRNFDWLKRHGR